MSHGEFVEWAAFYSVEPFGEYGHNLRTAMLMSLLANINRDDKKRPQPFELDDFMPDWWEEPSAVQNTGASLAAKFRNISERVNAQNAIANGKYPGNTGD